MTTYGTSIHQGRVRMQAAVVYAGANLPADPVVTRDVICNNLDHYADSIGQARWAWSPATGTYASKSFLTPRTTGVVVDTWYQITCSGAFPLPLRASGEGYRLRVRLGGASSGGHAVKFALVIAPVGAAPAILNDSTSDSVFETATTTAASAWLTGASQGSGAYARMVALSAAECAAYMRNVDTPVDLAGARSAVSQCLVNVVVFGSTANTGSNPQLTGGYAQEWVG